MTSADVYAPPIWPAEVASVVARELNKQTISLQDTTVFFDMVETFRIHVVASDTDPAAIFRAARQHRLSGYDATYVELAIALGLPLATADEDMCDAAGRAGVSLHLPPTP
jgi:predicted nucleic acid-binding protein